MKYNLEKEDQKILNEVKLDFPGLISATGEEAIIQTIISLRLRWYLKENK